MFIHPEYPHLAATVTRKRTLATGYVAKAVELIGQLKEHNKGRGENSVPTDAETYMLLPYAIEVVPDITTDGGVCYLASHPELPGCMAHGDTPEEALQNLEDARRLYITTLTERGIPIPRPKATTGAPHCRREIIWTAQQPIRPQPKPEPMLELVEVKP